VIFEFEYVHIRSETIPTDLAALAMAKVMAKVRWLRCSLSCGCMYVEVITSAPHCLPENKVKI
jgi:hypothetical protein